MKSRMARVPERRIPGILVMAVVLISMFLVAIWVLSAPADTSKYSGTTNKAPVKSEESVPETELETEEEAVVDEKLEDERQEKIEDEKELDSGDPERSHEPTLENDTEGSGDDDQIKQSEESSEQKDEIGTGSDKELDPQTEQEKHTETSTNTDTEQQGTDGEKLELTVESKETPKSSLITQAKESTEEKIIDVIEKEGTVDQKVLKDETLPVDSDGKKKQEVENSDGTTTDGIELGNDGKYKWKLCKGDSAQDYIPCLDNKKAIDKLPSRKHFEHRERHCPVSSDALTCLVPLPEGYRARIDWPESRQKIWHANVPHDKLVEYKSDQNWVTKQGDVLVFPGGGTQFKNGALQYIESVHKIVPENISWGKSSRVILDVGCGVASFGGFMFDQDGLVMSFAPKDEHEAQVQMALERGIPAFLSVMGTKRLVFPSNVYDVVHCARCRVLWHAEGGKLLLELNRVLRPGGYFIWSATPVYRLNSEEMKLWEDTVAVTEAMCWKLVIRTKIDPETQIGYAVFQKPVDNDCYEKRAKDEPPMCDVDDTQDAAWYVDMNSCLHRIPSGEGARGTEWPADWPARVETPPKWLKSVPKGIYGEPAHEEFISDAKHWRTVVEDSYLKNLGIQWSSIRNVMDMRAGYGGFAAALTSQPVWVMNVIPTDEPDTLPIIFDRGLFGLYHDWCESFSTYPRTYDLLHADHLFSRLQKRCSISNTVIEIDRILRPTGWTVFRDKLDVMGEIQEIITSLHWNIHYTYKEGEEMLIAAQKGMWRPDSNL